VKDTSVSDLIFCGEFAKDILKKKNILSKKSLKFSTVAFNIKEYLKFPSFIFWILPNLAKYTYGRLPISNITKLKRENMDQHRC
jgi:hypothetical protein